MAEYDDTDIVFTTEDRTEIDEKDVDEYLKTIDEVDYGSAMSFNDSKQHAIDVYENDEDHGESVAMHFDGHEEPYVIISNDGSIIADDGVTSFSSIDSAKEWLESQYQDDTEASVRQAHDVSNLDAAIVSLSEQLALDPDTELADLLDELVEYRQAEHEETAEDEIEEHGENVPITEQDD